MSLSSAPHVSLIPSVPGISLGSLGGTGPEKGSEKNQDTGQTFEKILTSEVPSTSQSHTRSSGKKDALPAVSGEDTPKGFPLQDPQTQGIREIKGEQAQKEDQTTILEENAEEETSAVLSFFPQDTQPAPVIQFSVIQERPFGETLLPVAPTSDLSGSSLEDQEDLTDLFVLGQASQGNQDHASEALQKRTSQDQIKSHAAESQDQSVVADASPALVERSLFQEVSHKTPDTQKSPEDLPPPKVHPQKPSVLEAPETENVDVLSTPVSFEAGISPKDPAAEEDVHQKIKDPESKGEPEHMLSSPPQPVAPPVAQARPQTPGERGLSLETPKYETGDVHRASGARNQKNSQQAVPSSKTDSGGASSTPSSKEPLETGKAPEGASSPDLALQGMHKDLPAGMRPSQAVASVAQPDFAQVLRHENQGEILYKGASDTPSTGLQTVRSGSQESSALGSTTLLSPVTDQVGIQIRKSLEGGGAHKIRVSLQPASLGHVDVQMEMSHDGHLKVVVAAERHETHEWLQRDSRTLERVLQESGFKTDQQSLSFQFRGGDGGGQQRGFASNPLPRDEKTLLEAQVTLVSEGGRRSAQANGRLDLEV